MKQYFDFEDIKNNSTEEERQKWFHAINKYEKANNYRLESPTISKMIEFLHSQKKQNEQFEIHAPIGLINEWIVWYGNGNFPKKYESVELIDALWEAVKSIL